MSTVSNPWATTSEEANANESTASNPWGGTSDTQSSDAAAMSASSTPAEATEFSLLQPFQEVWIPLDNWIETGVGWVVTNFRPFFTAIKAPVDATLTAVDSAFNAAPPLLVIALFGLIAWQLSGRRLAVGSVLGLVVLGAIGAWQESMTTLALVLTSVLFCIGLGIPTGIAMARSDRAAKVIRPILDIMQTTPAFVYLVPIVMLFGIGNVPGVIVTIIFAVAPVIRLTNLGIRQVPSDLIEAANSFGADKKQMLFKVQLPLAMPTIMAGVNQTLMLGLSMVVIASMISVGGLGLMVLRGIGRLDIGLATIGGIGIVILAVILDRMTQSLGQDARQRGTRHWYETGPVGLLLALKKSKS
ncbi:proline/glycine betaine ABC transporter permease ProW [Marinomonas hwangdonensis]|uniref:Proline/glycine betaine ABC transporter permease ProW n=1 Tax=Marinomonas hwangdonensis TaxID=1053647 RepID=A0A3M8Q4U8_9GAMM|nr:glycine betaine/L-proline ABC transporter permease ProW [Marinomonas hwangdonensis]RNF51126.1 proline/glycine betaine ABC transporter permease ProW [Marinomonas hwangdonensis]